MSNGRSGYIGIYTYIHLLMHGSLIIHHILSRIMLIQGSLILKHTSLTIITHPTRSPWCSWMWTNRCNSLWTCCHNWSRTSVRQVSWIGQLELLLLEGVLFVLFLRTRSALLAVGTCSGVDDETINDVDVADSSNWTSIASAISLICGISSEFTLAKCRTLSYGWP